MSLLKRGPHVVTVTPMVESRDELGSTLEPGTPVTVGGCMVQPVSVSEQTLSLSEGANTVYRVLGAGPWPGGLNSAVHVDVGPPGAQGWTFDQQGEAKTRSVSARTANFSVLMRASGAEVT